MEEAEEAEEAKEVEEETTEQRQPQRQLPRRFAVLRMATPERRRYVNAATVLFLVESADLEQRPAKSKTRPFKSKGRAPGKPSLQKVTAYGCQWLVCAF